MVAELAAWWAGQWPNVYPNLIASGICTVVVWVKVHLEGKRRKAHHEHIRDLLEQVHQSLDERNHHGNARD